MTAFGPLLSSRRRRRGQLTVFSRTASGSCQSLTDSTRSAWPTCHLHSLERAWKAEPIQRVSGSRSTCGSQPPGALFRSRGHTPRNGQEDSRRTGGVGGKLRKEKAKLGPILSGDRGGSG